ncbi:MAG: DNA-protecting protein DprA [Desulfamplus sp.]|nr:DNA-protecting protein DprA [Desulfamplus sp.]
MSHTIDHYLPWFILKNIPGVGNILYRRLIERFGSPEDVLNAHRHDLMTIKGMGNKALSAILNPAFRNSPAVDELKNEIREIEKCGFKITTMVEDNYPSLLKQIPDLPPYFTYIGSLNTITNNKSDEVLPLPSISIVGSREATPYGLNTAETLAYDLVLNGFEVVSGMALGIDTAAHKGALRAGGRTVAVLGSGLCKIYPSENRKLFYRIADNGAVISEFKVNSEPEGRHFPMRNRIIAGMSLGTVVVEAAKKSGSLITARLAADYNREVFAVPGDIHSFKSAGTHALLKQGAKLVANYMDVVEELTNIVPLTPENNKLFNMIETKKLKSRLQDSSLFEEKLQHQDNALLQNKSQLQLQPLLKHENLEPNLSLFETDNYQDAVLNMLKSSSSPIHIDEIIEQSGLDTGGITAALMSLELMGIVKHYPGKMFYKN